MANIITNESYQGAHIKGRIEYCQLRFYMVKERKNGKPWGKYTALLTDDYEPVALGSKNNKGRGDHGPQNVEDWQELFKKHYPAEAGNIRKAMESEISRIKGEIL